jgi:hypothetical protein
MVGESLSQDFDNRVLALAIGVGHQIYHTFIVDGFGFLPASANDSARGVGRFPRGIEICTKDFRHDGLNFRNYPAAMLANGP